MSTAVGPGWFRDTAELYGNVFRRGAGLALRNWPVALVLLGFRLLLDVIDAVTVPLGLVGGFLRYLAFVAFLSSWLFLVAEVIRTGRIRPSDWVAGLSAYFGDLLTVLFLFWILLFVAWMLLQVAPFLGIVLGLAMLTFGNAVPELVYLGRQAPASLLAESYRFIGENWIEWFPANVVLAGLVLGVTMLAMLVAPPGYELPAMQAANSFMLYFAMIVRGLLFQELSTSSRRARAFRRATR